MASYTNVMQAGSLLYVSGQGPVDHAGTIMTGKVGADVSLEDAHAHAQLVGLNILAALRDHCGTLDRVTSVVKLLGMVNSVPEFKKHPFVIDGCSNLLVEVFGPAGVHARSAVGMGSLPGNITVEIEAIFATDNS